MEDISRKRENRKILLFICILLCGSLQPENYSKVKITNGIFRVKNSENRLMQIERETNLLKWIKAPCGGIFFGKRFLIFHRKFWAHEAEYWTRCTAFGNEEPLIDDILIKYSRMFCKKFAKAIQSRECNSRWKTLLGYLLNFQGKVSIILCAGTLSPRLLLYFFAYFIVNLV